MEPILLQIEDIPLPSPGFDNYACWEDPLRVSLEMIPGNMVQEERGMVWRVRYASDYLGDSIMRPLLEYLRSGRVIATALPDNADEPVTAAFLVDSLTPPSLLALDGTEPIWHNLSFTLREEEPHD